MKFLTLIRHAKSSRDNPEWEDIDRPLNEKGRQSIEWVGKFLKEKQIYPNLLIASPAKRALETAKGITKWVSFPVNSIQIEENLYWGIIKDLIKILEAVPDEWDDIFLFGHEPLLSSLINHLTGETLVKFPTCAAYRIAFNINKWSAIASEMGKCEFFVYPGMLQKG